jgi:prepilin-type N-terminal cleavage/methylation domain-containing protein
MQRAFTPLEARRPLTGFTLIELLVVIAIIAVLAIVVILTLNPGQLLAQARDSNRLSDLSSLQSALGYYTTDAGVNGVASLGSPSTVYVSIFDPAATSTAGDQCQGLGLPSLPAAFAYHCAASSTSRLVDGTGWIPVNFRLVSNGSPLGQLPIDPVNTSSTRFYYAYTPSGGQYELTSIMESQKYQNAMANDGGSYDGLYQKGTALDITPPFRSQGLVGYWPMDEGSGTTAQDQSGSGNAGSWSGTQTGTSGYYSVGQVGPWAGTFNSTNDYVVIPPDDSRFGTGSSGIFTYSFWIKSSSYSGSILSRRNPCNNDAYFNITAGGNTIKLSSFSNIDSSSCSYTSGNVLTANQWNHVVITRQWGVASTTKLYVNGIQDTFTLVGSDSSIEPNYTGLKEYIGAQESISTCFGPVTNFFNGLIDDVRIYNRALSAAEVQAIYNAEK